MRATIFLSSRCQPDASLFFRSDDPASSSTTARQSRRPSTHPAVSICTTSFGLPVERPALIMVIGRHVWRPLGFHRILLAGQLYDLIGLRLMRFLFLYRGPVIQIFWSAMIVRGSFGRMHKGLELVWLRLKFLGACLLNYFAAGRDVSEISNTCAIQFYSKVYIFFFQVCKFLYEILLSHVLVLGCPFVTVLLALLCRRSYVFVVR